MIPRTTTPPPDPDVLMSLTDVQDRCLHLLEEAASVAANVGTTLILLPNLYSGVGTWELVAIGRRRPWRLLPIPHKVGPFTFFYTRKDHTTWKRNSLHQLFEDYDCSELVEWEEKELIDKLNTEGKWGPFLSQNNRLLHQLKRAIEVGDFDGSPSSKDWVPWGSH